MIKIATYSLQYFSKYYKRRFNCTYDVGSKKDRFYLDVNQPYLFPPCSTSITYKYRQHTTDLTNINRIITGVRISWVTFSKAYEDQNKPVLHLNGLVAITISAEHAQKLSHLDILNDLIAGHAEKSLLQLLLNACFIVVVHPVLTASRNPVCIHLFWQK